MCDGLVFLAKIPFELFEFLKICRVDGWLRFEQRLQNIVLKRGDSTLRAV